MASVEIYPARFPSRVHVCTLTNTHTHRHAHTNTACKRAKRHTHTDMRTFSQCKHTRHTCLTVCTHAPTCTHRDTLAHAHVSAHTHTPLAGHWETVSVLPCSVSGLWGSELTLIFITENNHLQPNSPQCLRESSFLLLPLYPLPVLGPKAKSFHFKEKSLSPNWVASTGSPVWGPCFAHLSLRYGNGTQSSHSLPFQKPAKWEPPPTPKACGAAIAK